MCAGVFDLLSSFSLSLLVSTRSVLFVNYLDYYENFAAYVLFVCMFSDLFRLHLLQVNLGNLPHDILSQH